LSTLGFGNRQESVEASDYCLSQRKKADKIRPVVESCLFIVIHEYPE